MGSPKQRSSNPKSWSRSHLNSSIVTRLFPYTTPLLPLLASIRLGLLSYPDDEIFQGFWVYWLPCLDETEQADSNSAKNRVKDGLHSEQQPVNNLVQTNDESAQGKNQRREVDKNAA